MIRKGLDGGNYKPLTEDSVKKIHQNVMRVIAEVGFQVNSETAITLFQGAGANIDREKRLVRLHESKVMELIQMAPSEITLCGQEEKNDIFLGGSRVYVGTGGTALYLWDQRKGERRLATLSDLQRIARLVDGLENIHLFLLPTYPSDLPIEKVDVNRFFVGLDNTSKHIMGGVYTLDGVKKVIRMAEMIAGSPSNLRERPIISMITCTISPLVLDKQYGDLLVPIVEAGIPVAVPSEPLCGATSPITLAGNLVVQVVDSLMAVMLVQLIKPGAPVIFGSVASTTDLSDFKYLGGSVEMGLVNAAAAQMSQFYKLPYYATGGMSDSKVLDAQSGYESALTNTLCALAGSNFIHDAAGLMEFAMSVCDEKYVIDNEILGMVMRAVDGIKVTDETIAFDLIKEVGAGGNFVTAHHTRRFMRKEHYQPTLSDRNTREDWTSIGSQDAFDRASHRVDDILANHRWRLPEDTRQRVFSEVKDIVDGLST
ncbi:MAG: trimethylamine methyltransferase family protein [Chloroflexota bacterium]|nr:trimethylamine methyltransferase family protein [Chloroflexota bacterium]